MSNSAWLIVALVLVAVAIGGYIWALSARRRRLVERFEELSHGRRTS